MRGLPSHTKKMPTSGSAPTLRFACVRSLSAAKWSSIDWAASFTLPGCGLLDFMLCPCIDSRRVGFSRGVTNRRCLSIRRQHSRTWPQELWSRSQIGEL